MPGLEAVSMYSRTRGTLPVLNVSGVFEFTLSRLFLSGQVKSTIC